jgi:hypothetical protein
LRFRDKLTGRYSARKWRVSKMKRLLIAVSFSLLFGLPLSWPWRPSRKRPSPLSPTPQMEAFLPSLGCTCKQRAGSIKSSAKSSRSRAAAADWRQNLLSESRQEKKMSNCLDRTLSRSSMASRCFISFPRGRKQTLELTRATWPRRKGRAAAVRGRSAGSVARQFGHFHHSPDSTIPLQGEAGLG